MEFSEEWKSLWPIAEVYSSPLLLDHPPPPSKRPRQGHREEKDEKTHEEIGPIIFTPCPKTLVQLHSSASLAPRLPFPYPRLSLARFLKTSCPFFLHSDASAIASELGPQEGHSFSYSYFHGFNSLQLLSYKGGPSEESVCLAFFPTGENCDQVGYFKFGIKDSEVGFGLNCGNQRVSLVSDRLNSRILKLLVNPVSGFEESWDVNSATSSSARAVAVIGYLMVCTLYSVHWYLVKFGSDGFGGKSAMVEVLGHSLFRSSAVVNACWSPHLSEEGAVLLETGELYLFDVSPSLEKHSISCNKVGKNKLKVLWGEDIDLEITGQACWLTVEFSWHPRILIVANGSAIFMVDARFEGCKVSCLLKIEKLSLIKNERFLTLCRAGCDAFTFCVASRRLLLLCDVRQPFRPLLKWVHNLDNPCYITVFMLSELRSNTKHDKFKWATESGCCILLGSFWNCEFSHFIYGPKNSRRSVSSEISKFCNSFHAWGLPSEFSFSGNDTHCGDCLVREEFSKEALPDWIDWRQKKDVVMGFGILDRDPWAQLPEADGLSGFTLIRLMSSGKLEAMRYQAVWEFDPNLDEAHHKELSGSLADLLYDVMEEKYDFQNKTQFLMLEYLGGHLKGNLDGVLAKKMNKFLTVSLLKAIKKEIDVTLECTEPTVFGSVSRIFDVFKGINLPTSVHEIAVRSIWAGMPKYLVHLALSCHSDNPELPKSMEASGVRNQMRMPQFAFEMLRVQDSNAFVPPHFLLTLHKLYVEKLARNRRSDIGKIILLSADDELKVQCNRVMEVADELTGSNSETDSQFQDGYAVSLADNNDNIVIEDGNVKNFFFHKPVALLDEDFTVKITLEKSGTGKKKFTTFEKFGTGSKRFTNFLFRKQEVHSIVNPDMVGPELLNVGCPLELKFKDLSMSFGPKELKTFQMLKNQDLDFQKGFCLYQEYLSSTNLVNQNK